MRRADVAWFRFASCFSLCRDNHNLRTRLTPPDRIASCYGQNILRKNLINIFPMGNYYKSYCGFFDQFQTNTIITNSYSVVI
jgi:hypothetical protein